MVWYFPLFFVCGEVNPRIVEAVRFFVETVHFFVETVRFFVETVQFPLFHMIHPLILYSDSPFLHLYHLILHSKGYPYTQSVYYSAKLCSGSASLLKSTGL